MPEIAFNPGIACRKTVILNRDAKTRDPCHPYRAMNIVIIYYHTPSTRASSPKTLTTDV